MAWKDEVYAALDRALVYLSNISDADNYSAKKKAEVMEQLKKAKEKVKVVMAEEAEEMKDKINEEE